MSIFDDLAKEKRNLGINFLTPKTPSWQTPITATVATPQNTAGYKPPVPISNVPIAPKLPPVPQYDYSQYSMATNPNPATGGRDIYKGGIRQSYEQMLPSFQAGFNTANIKNVYQEPQLPQAPVVSQAPVIPPTTETPTLPEPPKVDYLSELQKRILASLTPTSEESTLATQYADTDKQLSDLIASKELGISGLEGQGRGIPLSLIRGQQGKLAEQAGLQALPLQAQLANLQAKRNIEADKRKAAMDVATTQMSFEEKRQEREEKARTTKAQQEFEVAKLQQEQVKYQQEQTNIDRKFQEDARQYGMDYALKEKQLAESQRANRASEGLAYMKATEPKAMTVAQETAQIKKQEQETQAQQQASQGIGLINNLLSGNRYEAISGVIQTGSVPFWGDRTAVNEYDQLQGMLKLGIRKMIKGQGQVSDYEGKILAQAASSLSRLTDENSMRDGLIKARGVLKTNNGQTTTVEVINPETNERITSELSGAEIYQLVSEGNQVIYK